MSERRSLAEMTRESRCKSGGPIAWGELFSEHVFLTAPQWRAIYAVVDANTTTSGYCMVSSRTARYDHKTTVSALAVKALERSRLVVTHHRGQYPAHWTQMLLADRAVIAFKRDEQRANEAGRYAF